jgi:indolepyruvate ferredoxin oxidoreductase
VERALIGEYRQLLETALVRLSPITHAAVVALAELPDEVRGYEHLKLASVARFREKATQLIAQLN